MMNRVLYLMLFLLGMSYSYAQVEWTGIKPALEKRIEASSVAYQGKIYIFHGYLTGWIPSHTSEVYDPQTDTWSWLAPLPSGPKTGMTHNGTALVDNEVWLAGGKSSGGNVLTNKVWIYNIPQNSWRPGPALPENIGTGSLIKFGRKLHLFGGGTHPKGTTPSLTNFCIPNPNTYTLDLDNPTSGWQLNKVAPIPEGFVTIHHATAVYQGKVYVIGGQLGHDCGTQDKPWLFSYDPYTNVWTRLQDMPVANAHAEPSTFVVDGKIIVTGGEKDNIPSGKIFEYNIATNEWREIDHLRGLAGNLIGRLAASAKVIGNKMFVSHGGSGLPVNLAYSKSFARNQVLALGFNPEMIQIELDYGNHQSQKSAWLWTSEGRIPFKLHTDNLPEWLQIKADSVDMVDESTVEIKCSFDSKNLAPGVYQYKLGATAPGYSDATLIIELRVKTSPNILPPSVPQHLTLDYSTRQIAQISWDHSLAPVDYYEIFRADFGTPNFQKIGQVSDSEYIDVNLVANSHYVYKVRAVNPGGSSPFSHVLEVKTKPYTPATPEQLSAQLQTDQSCYLSWQQLSNENSEEEIQFEIYRRVNQPETPLFAFLANTYTLNYTDTTLKPQTEYAYIIRAVNSGGKSSFTKPVFITSASIASQEENLSLNPEKSSVEHLTVYPNPGKDEFYVQIPENFSGDNLLLVSDMLGNEIFREKVSLNTQDSDYKLSTYKLPPGIYLLRLQKEGKSISTYLLKW
ncbi:MAG: kelch repeat-containing protein [Microscillaceae bacterium]|nr:kelch repeat-containing protein [Microscillaceae bacterium]